MSIQRNLRDWRQLPDVAIEIYRENMKEMFFNIDNSVPLNPSDIYGQSMRAEEIVWNRTRGTLQNESDEIGRAHV